MVGALSRKKTKESNSSQPPDTLATGKQELAAEEKTAPPSPAPARAETSRTESAAMAERETQVVTFYLGREEYAIDILQVQEIVMMTEITRMPRTPRFVEGIVNLRGQMIPIINMRKRFDLPHTEHTLDTRIIIVDIGSEIVGIVVDGVRDVIRLPDSAISPPPSMIEGINSEYIKGIGKPDNRLLIMLDLGRVLSANEHEVLRDLTPDEMDKRTGEPLRS